jgi:hypothetical protein
MEHTPTIQAAAWREQSGNQNRAGKGVGLIMFFMANKPTYDDANLLLRLYELRREETIRKARGWMASFSPESAEDVQKAATFGSQENAYYRMVTSYWDMAASFVTSGVLNEALFLQNSGELLFVWEKCRTLIEEMRGRMKNPTYLQNLESLAKARIEAMGPETYESWSRMIRGAAAATRA